MSSETITLQKLKVYNIKGELVGWGELIWRARDNHLFSPTFYSFTDGTELSPDFYIVQPDGEPQLMVSTRMKQ